MESRKWGAGAVSFYWFWSGTMNFSVSSFFSVVCLDFKLWIGILDTNSEQGAGNLTEIQRFTGSSADATKNLMGRGWHRNAEIFHFNWKQFKLMKRSFPNQGRSQELLFFVCIPWAGGKFSCSLHGWSLKVPSLWNHSMTPARKPGKEQKSYFRTLSTMGSVISCGAEGFKKDINYIYQNLP